MESEELFLEKNLNRIMPLSINELTVSLAKEFARVDESANAFPLVIELAFHAIFPVSQSKSRVSNTTRGLEE